MAKKGKILKKVRTRTEEQDALLREVRGYQSRMRMRIGVTNQIFAMKKYDLIADDEADAMTDDIAKPLMSQEGKLMRRTAKALANFPIWNEWMKHVVGVGPGLAIQMIAHIQPRGEFPTVGHLWAYSGYKVDNKTGDAVRRKAGVQSNWNDELKMLGFQLGESFIKQTGSAYRELYDRYKLRMVTTHPEPVDTGKKDRNGKAITKYTKGHIHNMSRRYITKMFLSHLWEVWRESEGLPVRVPYPIEYLGHTSRISPWSFVKLEGDDEAPVKAKELVEV